MGAASYIWSIAVGAPLEVRTRALAREGVSGLAKAAARAMADAQRAFRAARGSSLKWDSYSNLCAVLVAL